MKEIVTKKSIVPQMAQRNCRGNSMWIVNATPPSIFSNSGWDFRANFFPRTVAYKKDAKALADEAKRKGASNVTISKSKK